MSILRSASLLVVLSIMPACDAALQAKAQQDAEAQAAVAAEAQAKGPAASTTVVAKADASADVKTAVNTNVSAKADVNIKVEPAAFDLESVSFLVKKGKVKDAKALEKKINTPKEKLNNIDIDGDGKIDKIVIVEVKKDDGTIIFELHAVPSKSKNKDEAIIVAYVNFVPDKTTNVLIVKATYAPIFIGYDTIVYDYNVPIVVTNDTIVVTGGVGFYGWLYTVHRPSYYGVFVYDFEPAPLFIIDVSYGYQEGGCWPPGHCKHGKWKSNGGYYGGGKHGGKHGKH